MYTFVLGVWYYRVIRFWGREKCIILIPTTSHFYILLSFSLLFSPFLCPLFPSLSLSFSPYFWLHLIPLNLSPHPCVAFFFSNPRSLLLEQQYVYTRLPWQPEEATWAGGWTKDPETLIHRESERARDGEWEGEREREREGKSDFIFRRGVWCVWKMRRWRRMERRRGGGGMDSVGEVSS